MKQYDKHARTYITMRDEGIQGENFNPNVHIEMPAMFKLVGEVKGKKLLDLGCGHGLHAMHYAKRGALVVAMDSAKKLIAHAESLQIENAEFMVRDIRKKLPFKNGTFDIITCSLVFDHLKNLKVFKECYRVLKKGGKMYFSIPNPVLYQEEHIAGLKKNETDVDIYGNYFTRRNVLHDWRGEVEITSYHKPLHDYFDAFLGAGFVLEKFVEPEPVRAARKLDIVGYEFTSRNPYFLLFRLGK